MFTRESKEETVRLVEDSNRKATEIARRLGIHPNLLDNTLRGVLAEWLVDSALNCATGVRTE